MQTITTIGVDIANSVFQVHGIDAAMPGWHRRLRLVAPLVARASSTWPYRTMDATGFGQPTFARNKKGSQWESLSNCLSDFSYIATP
jgi:hypothetical protein